MTDPVLAHALGHKTALIEALKDLVACPSVGADPAMAQGMEDARALIEALGPKPGWPLSYDHPHIPPTSWKTIVEAGPFTEDEQRFVDRFRKLRPLWFHRRQAWRGKTRPRV